MDTTGVHTCSSVAAIVIGGIEEDTACVHIPPLL